MLNRAIVSQKNSLLFPALLLGIFLCMGVLLVIPLTHSAEPVSGDVLMQQGKTLFERGQFDQAAQTWNKAARFFEQQGELKNQTEALMYLSQALYHGGQYQKAGITLSLAKELANDQTIPFTWP